MFKILSRFSLLMIMLIITILLAWDLGHRLDNFGIKGIRLQLGYVGTLLLLLSMTYSIRKRWRKGPGRLPNWLLMHEYFALVGTILIVVHAGDHYYAKLPAAATLMMVIINVSGLTGQYLYKEAARKKKEHPVNALFTDSPIRFWRMVHVQLTALVGAAVVTHVATVGYFGGLS